MMVVSKRPRGRPKTGQSQVGRERVIAAVRKLLRTDKALAMQRAEVARAADVTPALISHYFPDHLKLLEAATEPIVDEYMREMLSILRANEDPGARLHAIIGLFVRVHLRDPHIVDCYVDLVRRKANDGKDIERLLGAYHEITAALGQYKHLVPAGGNDPGLIVFALWGMCRSVAQDPALPVPLIGSNHDVSDQEARLADMIFGLLGAAGSDRPPSGSPG